MFYGYGYGISQCSQKGTTNEYVQERREDREVGRRGKKKYKKKHPYANG